MSSMNTNTETEPKTKPVTITSTRTTKIEVIRKTLLESLVEAKRYADKRSSMPIIATVSLTLEGEILRVQATDLALAFSETLKTTDVRETIVGNAADLPEIVGACIDATKLHDVIKALEDSLLTLEIAESHSQTTSTLGGKGQRCSRDEKHVETFYDGRKTCAVRPYGSTLACGGEMSSAVVSTSRSLSFAVVAKKSRYKLQARPATDFPKLPDHYEVDWQPVAASVISDLVEGVFSSISTDETRTPLFGMLLESAPGALRAVSTDGHRASLVERSTSSSVKLPSKDGVLVPRPFCVELKKIAGSKGIEALEIGFSGGAAGTVFVRATGSARVYSARLADASFPPYRQLIPKTCGRSAEVRRESLVKVLKRLLLVASEKSRKVLMKWEADEVILTADDVHNEATERLAHTNGRNLTISCEGPRDGDHFEIACDIKYLLDSLAQLSTDTIWIGMSDEAGKWGDPPVPYYGEQAPFLVRASADAVDTYCTMPMRP